MPLFKEFSIKIFTFTFYCLFAGHLEDSEDDIKKALERFASQIDSNNSMFPPQQASAPKGRIERRVSWVDKIPTRW